MSTKAFRSAARCPHCEQHMIPRRVGGDRYGSHIKNCPQNIERVPAKKLSVSLFVRARFRILGREIQSCGKDFLHMMFICTNCFRFRYSNLPPQGVLCSSCGVCMHHVFSGEEIILDKYSLPKNFQFFCFSTAAYFYKPLFPYCNLCGLWFGHALLEHRSGIVLGHKYFTRRRS